MLCFVEKGVGAVELERSDVILVVCCVNVFGMLPPLLRMEGTIGTRCIL